jgi:hypothetical protein
MPSIVTSQAFQPDGVARSVKFDGTRVPSLRLTSVRTVAWPVARSPRNGSTIMRSAVNSASADP